MRQLWPWLVAVVCLSVSGCSSEAAQSGVGEPLRVTNGQFFQGSFPGSAQPTAVTSRLAVSQLSTKNGEFAQGTTGKVLSGVAGPDAQAVALSLQGLGHGFWVLPVSGPDFDTPGTFQWAATMDFARDLPVGMLPLQVAASDASGRFGPTSVTNLLIDSLLPKGHVVAQLTWGADSDLDLHIVGPSGTELDPKHPNTIGSDDVTGKPAPHSGLLDHDSLAACVPDGLRTENVVWTDNPTKGTYLVRADMFSSCGKPAATFVFSLYVDGQVVLTKTGRLLDIDADGGGPGSGLYVTEFTCEGSGTCS